MQEQILNMYRERNTIGELFQEDLYIYPVSESERIPELLTLYAYGDSICKHGYHSKINTFTFNIEVVLDGKMKYACGHESWYLTAGDIILESPEHRGSFSVISQNNASKMFIMIYTGRLANLLFNSGPLYQCQYLRPENSESIIKRFKGIKDLCKNGCPNQMMRISNELYAVITELIYTHINPTEISNSSFVSKLNQLISQTFKKKITLMDVARHFGVSKRTLNRMFQDHFNCSPMQYFLKQKMEYALFLLQHTNTPVQNISGECGFSDPIQFSHSFSRSFGMSPGKYRKK